MISKNLFFQSAISISCLLLLGTVSGCAGMNSDFTCPMQPGQMCSSLDQVNKMVDQGRVGGNHKVLDASSGSIESSGNAEVTPYPVPAIKADDPLRYGESVMRVWVAPYEDKDGNYHQPSLMYSVVRPGHWIGNPVHAVTEDE